MILVDGIFVRSQHLIQKSADDFINLDFHFHLNVKYTKREDDLLCQDGQFGVDIKVSQCTLGLNDFQKIVQE